jgi:hypothetical protein
MARASGQTGAGGDPKVRANPLALKYREALAASGASLMAANPI